MGTPGAPPPPGGRQAIAGWSATSARNQKRWLYSVDVGTLDGHGWAITLTLADCPSSADEWHAARKAWVERVRRLGLVRLHWVTEWQARGVPHLHAAVYVTDGSARAGALLLDAWLQVCARRSWRASVRSQDAKRITGATGWLEYLSKHAGRSVAHYQRMGMPDGWSRTGRLWGHSGAWSTLEPVEAVLGPLEAVRMRRLVDAYVIAAARARGDFERVRYLRRRRRLERDPYRSRMLGVSEWIPESAVLRLLDVVA